MASPRDRRRLALLVLFQIDQTDGPPPGARDEPLALASVLDDLRSLADEGLTFQDGLERASDADRERAVAMALDAWDERARADAALLELAPEWPSHRQASVDRCILRLSVSAMRREPEHAGAIINEAVEMAKQFSGEKSPAFVNALLDGVRRGTAGAAAGV